MISLKTINPQLKVMLSLGGWGGCETCSDVFAIKKNRKAFAKSVKEHLAYFKADGIDLDWEYPAVAGFAGHKFAAEDKDNFTELVKQLRKKLGNKMIISFAAGVSKKILETGIDWPKVMKTADWVNLMTYDMVGAGSTLTGHHTVLYSTTQQPVSTDYTVNYLTGLGVPADKLVIGGAFYGKIFMNVPDTANGLYQPATFQSTSAYKNMLSQYTSQSGYNYYWDDTAKAPFLYNPTEKRYITFDDKKSLQVKTQYAIDKKLSGIMFWQLGQDAYEDGLLDAISNTKQQVK
jgi:chitinase